MGKMELSVVVFLQLVVFVHAFINGIRPTQQTTTTYYGHITEPGHKGAFSSPGYPGNYPDNYEYIYQIGDNLRNQPVTIHFKYFNLEYCPDCSCDSLKISPVNPYETPQTFCGSDLPNTNGYVYTQSSVIVWFKTNGANHGNGFYATFEVHDPITGTPPYGYWSTNTPPTPCPKSECPSCPNGYLKWKSDGQCPRCECHETATLSTTTPQRTEPHRDFTTGYPYWTTNNYQWKTTETPFYFYHTTWYPYQTTENYPWKTSKGYPKQTTNTRYPYWRTHTYPWSPQPSWSSTRYPTYSTWPRASTYPPTTPTWPRASTYPPTTPTWPRASTYPPTTPTWPRASTYPPTTPNSRGDLLMRLLRIQQDAIAVEDKTHTLEADINAAILYLEQQRVVSDTSEQVADKGSRKKRSESRIIPAL